MTRRHEREELDDRQNQSEVSYVQWLEIESIYASKSLRNESTHTVKIGGLPVPAIAQTGTYLLQKTEVRDTQSRGSRDFSLPRSALPLHCPLRDIPPFILRLITPISCYSCTVLVTVLSAAYKSGHVVGRWSVVTVDFTFLSHGVARRSPAKELPRLQLLQHQC